MDGAVGEGRKFIDVMQVDSAYIYCTVEGIAANFAKNVESTRQMRLNLINSKIQLLFNCLKAKVIQIILTTIETSIQRITYPKLLKQL